MEMKLYDKPFELIREGKKTVEVRLYDDKRQKLRVGDVVSFARKDDETDVIKTEVVSLKRFSSFFELYSSELFLKTGSEGLSPREAAESMYVYYSKEDEKKFGVLAIELKIAE